MIKKALFLSIFVCALSLAKAQEQQTSGTAQPDLPGMLLFDYGVNILFNNPDDFDISPIRSRSIGFHYLYPLPLGESKFSIHPGLGISAHNYTFSDGVTLSIADSTEVV